MREKKEPLMSEGKNDLLPIPDDGLIVLPVRNFVAFPGTVFPLAVGRAASLAAVEQAVRGDRAIGILLQRDGDALRAMIRRYTREARVRNLERKIGAILRHVAVDIFDGKSKTVKITADDLKDSLGAPRYEN